jgi:hypothetical protein
MNNIINDYFSTEDHDHVEDIVAGSYEEKLMVLPNLSIENAKDRATLEADVK